MSPMVMILVGSESDREVMTGCLENLDRFGVPHELIVSSAHRAPEKTRALAVEARARGVRVIICAAGMAAALPGVVAAHTTLPVIGVPLDGSALSGVDSLHAMVQMPAGVPVATMAIGRAGARNAAILAVQILALSDESLRAKLDEHKAEMAGQ
jgi:5-(carboxyamino)imidazole ribonucleotide mutase